MATERKQVLTPDDQVSEAVSQVNAPTLPIGGTVHGDIANLSTTGTGFSDAPINTVLPTITGTAQEDEILVVSDGTWASQQPITEYSYQWLLDGGDITDETDAAYEIVEGDVDGVISCEVTATSAGGSAMATTAATDTVIAAE